MGHALKHLSGYGLKPSGIIHVGASIGQEVTAYRESGVRPVVLVEPLPKAFAALTAAVGQEPGMFAVQACCSDVEGRVVDFHVATNAGQSSSYLVPTGHIEIVPEVQFTSTLKLTTATLHNLIASTASTGGFASDQLDCLTIDAQGAERDILLGAGALLDHIKFIWMEVVFGGLYEGDTDVYTMIDFMRDRGFDLYLMKMNERSWGDALFIRQGTFRRSAS